MVYLVIVIIFAFIALLSVYIYKESNGYHVVKYIITDNRFKKDKISFVFLSDLHNRQYGELNSDLVKDIDKLNPDFIALGGDMITSCMEKWTDFSDTLKFVEKLAKKYPVYYGMGNHEERLNRKPDKFPEGCYEKLSSTLTKIGAPIIDDKKISIDDLGIDIYGLNLDHKYYRKVVTKKLPDDYLEAKLGTPWEGHFSILLAHNPEHFKSYAKWKADLVLSGHVHGGIIRLPFLGGVISPALKIFPKYDGGLFTEGNSTMILSRGIGTHTIPIRVNNKAELIYIELRKN